MKCYYCHEEIANRAKKCPYCGEFLDRDYDTSFFGRFDTFVKYFFILPFVLVVSLFSPKLGIPIFLILFVGLRNLVKWIPWIVLIFAIIWIFPIAGTNTFSLDGGSKAGFNDSQNLSSKMTEEEKDLSKLHSILELQKEGWMFEVGRTISIEQFMEVYPNWNKMNGQARAAALRVYGIQKN